MKLYKAGFLLLVTIYDLLCSASEYEYGAPFTGPTTFLKAKVSLCQITINSSETIPRGAELIY